MNAFGTNEIVIGDDNYNDHLTTVVNGQMMSTGLVPRDYQSCPVGYLGKTAKPFNLPLIPESEWQPRLDAQIAAKAQLSDVRNQGMFGKPIPSRDQNGKGYCHDDKTEVLTEKGWVNWANYNWTDLLGTMHPTNGLLQFQAPLQKHIYEYDGYLVHSNNKRIDFGVTPNHRMLVRKWDERKRTLSDNFSFQEAGALGWYVGLPHSTRGWIGTDLVKIAIEDDREYDGDDFFALIALVVSDGYAGNSEKGKDVVSFCCFDPIRRNMVAEFAKKLGYHEAERKGVWTRTSPALAAWIRNNCYTGLGFKAIHKRIPDIIKCGCGYQIKHFIKFFGDKNHNPDAQEVYYSSSKRLIDDLQELLLRIGKRSTICLRNARSSFYEDGNNGLGQLIESKETYQLYASSTDRLCLERQKNIETDKYKGLVYCATVPNGTLVTRRNGSVLVSGNCWAHSSVSAALIVRAVNNLPYADLSAYAVACIIKGYRDQGGWGAESLEWIAENGIPTSATWPQQSMSRSNDTPAMRAEAKMNRFTDWMDMEPRNKAQLVTCLLSGIPVVSDFNFWSHSVCTLDLVKLNPFTIRIWNSWGSSWSDNGTGLLTGSKAIPDGMICPNMIMASAA